MPAPTTRGSVLSPHSRRRVSGARRHNSHRTRRSLELLQQASRPDRQAEMSVGMSDELTAIQDAIWSKDVLQKICRTAVADGLYEAGLSGGTIEAQDDGGVVDKEYVVGTDVIDAHMSRMKLEHEQHVRREAELKKMKVESAGWKADQIRGCRGRRWSIATIRMALAGANSSPWLSPHAHLRAYRGCAAATPPPFPLVGRAAPCL